MAEGSNITPDYAAKLTELGILPASPLGLALAEINFRLERLEEPAKGVPVDPGAEGGVG
jgi:hypothetical protein